jgi:hypothetical protein
MEWGRILAYITGTVDQELLLRNEYLVAENRILKSQLKGRLKLSDVERITNMAGFNLRQAQVQRVEAARRTSSRFTLMVRWIKGKATDAPGTGTITLSC